MRLADVGEELISRGAVFRFPSGISWYSDYVTLMLLLDGNELCFVTVTGPKAGNKLNYLPEAAYAEGTRMTTGTWLFDNWKEWVWLEVDPTEVEYLPHLPEASGNAFKS